MRVLILFSRIVGIYVEFTQSIVSLVFCEFILCSQIFIVINDYSFLE